MRLSDEEVKQIYGRAKIPQEYVDVGLKKGVRAIKMTDELIIASHDDDVQVVSSQ